MDKFSQILITFGSVLIAASLAFYVRAKLDARALRIAELKIAYVHFVRFSQFLALEVTLKTIVKMFITKEVQDGLGKPGQYEASHEAAAAIAALIVNDIATKDKPPESVSSNAIFLSMMIETFEGSRMTDEQMSKLPRDSVVNHLHFQGLIDQLISIIKLWDESISKNDFKWATATALHEQWMLLVRLSAATRVARKSMLKFGVVTAEESIQILKQHAKHYEEVLGTYIQDGIKLKLAEKAISERNKPS